MLAVLLGCLPFANIGAQTFADFLTRINAAAETERQAIADSMISAIGDFPYIENDTLVHFIYTGSANSVGAPGDANGWDPATAPLSRISGTNFWYRIQIYESDARLDYKFVKSGSTWILDPRNPYTVMGGFGPNSELRMPDYTMPPEIEYYPEIDHGTIADTTLYSSFLGNSRHISVYLPPDYSISTASYSIVLVHDGPEYLSLANAKNSIDYLIHHNKIESIIVVFVPPVNRNDEYTGNLQSNFMRFIVEELMPWVDSHYRTETDPAKRAVMGASAGGNISLRIVMNHSAIFGNVAVQSSYIEEDIAATFQSGPTLNLKFYLDLGTYDLAILMPLVRSFVPILEEKGYPHIYNEYHEGHSWGFWHAHLGDILIYFFPANGSSIDGRTEPP